MLHIPILRHGQPYESVEKVQLLHHATGEPVAEVSQANAGLIARDVRRTDDAVLEAFTVAQLLDACKKAAAIFLKGTVPVGDLPQTFEDYIRQLSGTTGMPEALCRSNAAKIHRVLNEMDAVLAGLTRGFDLAILDRGFGSDQGRTLSWYREARVFGAVLPSNSPGVHALWIPAVAMKAPIVLKPGREEPWTPLRVIESLAAAGLPRQAFGFYPADHGGAAALLAAVDRAMLFGDGATTRPYRNDARIELHGPGVSKVILGPDTADRWEEHLDMMVSSILANGGRSCINASGVWMSSPGPRPRSAAAIADALGRRLAAVQPLGADDPAAQLAAFANPLMAQRISAQIDQALPGAEDVTQRHRGSPRLATRGRCAYLLPTIISCSREHPLAKREFPFPFASVVECPPEQMAASIGPTLVASVISQDPGFLRAMMGCPDINRLNVGAIPTWQLSWDQPHEGNLFEHLYRQRAFQMAGA